MFPFKNKLRYLQYIRSINKMNPLKKNPIKILLEKCFVCLLTSQPAIACPKLTIKTVEQDVKYIQI